MIDWARRWWRWMFNPTPMPGQVWYVDGIGLLAVRSITDRGHGRMCERANGESIVLTVDGLRSQGVLHTPRTLDEVAHG